MIDPDHRSRSGSPYRRLVLARGPILAFVILAFSSCPADADDTETAKLLKSKGVEVTETKGIVTGLNVQDGSKLTDDDFRQIARLTHLKTLSVNNGLNDDRLSQLANLRELERLGYSGPRKLDHPVSY